MSAIVVHADGLKEWKKRLSATDSGNQDWPYTIIWSDLGMAMEATVSGSWTGSFNDNGFTLTTIPYPGPSTSFIFSFMGASVGTSETATVYDSSNTPYDLLLEVIAP